MKTEEPVQNMHAREKRVTDHCCTKKVWKKKKKKTSLSIIFVPLLFLTLQMLPIRELQWLI